MHIGIMEMGEFPYNRKQVKDRTLPVLLAAEMCSFSGLNPISTDLVKPLKSTEVWDSSCC